MTVALGNNIALPVSSPLSYRLAFDTMGKLANYGKLGVTDLDAAIKALFANSEQGAWYDPSDLTTMFQDRAGTTPVTADGQTVGLILDKSKGLVLGPELVTNGTFDTNATGWTTSNSTLTVASGQLTVTTSSSGPSGISSQAITTVIGKKYRCDATAISTNANVWVAKSDQADSPFGTNSVRSSIDGAGSAALPIVSRWWFTATATTSYIHLVTGATSGNNAVFDNVSIKEYDGNHAVAPSDAARPLYKTDGTYHWLQFDGVGNSLSTEVIDFSATDKLSAFFGYKKYVSDSNEKVLIEIGQAGVDANATAFGINTNSASGATNRVVLRDGTNSHYLSNAAASPIGTYVWSANVDRSLSGVSEAPQRINGVSVIVSETGTSVTDSFNNYKFWLGARGGTGLFLQHNLYSMIVRSALSTTQEITDTETWVNGKTGAF